MRAASERKAVQKTAEALWVCWSRQPAWEGQFHYLARLGGGCLQEKLLEDRTWVGGTVTRNGSSSGQWPVGSRKGRPACEAAHAKRSSREGDDLQGRTLLLVVGWVAVPVVAVLKFDPQFANFGLGEDVWDPLNDERRRFLLIRGSVA